MLISGTKSLGKIEKIGRLRTSTIPESSLENCYGESLIHY